MSLLARGFFATTMALAALAGAAPSLAQNSCVDVCGLSCIKPFSFPDRWDDVTGITGYIGGGRRPDWRNNNHWDHEAFADADGDGLYSAGESYVDTNGNGLYDEELYDSASTGYSAAGSLLSPMGDVGLELVLHPGFGSPPQQGAYLAIALPPINKGTPVLGGDAYRENIENCDPSLVEPGDWIQTLADGQVGPTNQGMRELIAKDPEAAWDPVTSTVQNSAFPMTPRVIFLAVHDPRMPILAGHPSAVRVVRVIPFFMEQMVGPAEVRGRFLRTGIPPEVTYSACTAVQVGGFIVDCPVPAAPASWGHVKATYR